MFSKDTLDKVAQRPPYQDPAAAKHCPTCSKKLTLLNRRHCEADGLLYCRDCTKDKMDLTRLGFDAPAHVCANCSLKEQVEQDMLKK